MRPHDRKCCDVQVYLVLIMCTDRADKKAQKEKQDKEEQLRLVRLSITLCINAPPYPPLGLI